MIIDKETKIKLLKAAYEAKEYAYAPYSNFSVGAALLTKEGRIFTGCNIENASYGATNCAERTAIFKAISEGERDFLALAIVSDFSGYTFPCGICRQVISEFSKEFQVIFQNNKGEILSLSVKDLFPYPFNEKDLVK